MCINRGTNHQCPARKRFVEKGVSADPLYKNVIVAAACFRSAGDADAVFKCANRAWMKTHGALHAMVLPGSALIVASKMDMEISSLT